jgi:hypothetical protein
MIRAVERAEVLAEKGDLDGVAIWGQILGAIEAPMRGRRVDLSQRPTLTPLPR